MGFDDGQRSLLNGQAEAKTAIPRQPPVGFPSCSGVARHPRVTLQPGWLQSRGFQQARLASRSSNSTRQRRRAASGRKSSPYGYHLWVDVPALNPDGFRTRAAGNIPRLNRIIREEAEAKSVPVPDHEKAFGYDFRGEGPDVDCSPSATRSWPRPGSKRSRRSSMEIAKTSRSMLSGK